MTNSELRVIGYCERDKLEIIRMIEAGQSNHLLKMRGEFTLIYKNKKFETIISSYVGAMQYFYYYDGKTFCHADNIIEIIKKNGLDWAWDWVALADLCELENLTENRSLHRYIKKLPPGTILRFDGKLTMHSKRIIDTIDNLEVSDPMQAIDIFNEETSRWSSNKPYLSLSGGFDSRTILSSMLKQNIYPTLVTLGEKGCSDIEVSGEIANHFSLEHITVSIDLKDLLEKGEHIARITNGSKPACHWHTYLYPRKAGVPKNESFFVGTLGEFARSYYFDKGLAGIIMDQFGDNGQELFWKSKLKRHRTFTEAEISFLTPELAKQVSGAGLESRAKRNVRLSKGGVLSGGTRYYLEQRVPNFYANGITMYNDTTQWRSPFHNVDWLRIVWNLHETWKLGSNWHRLAIRKNCPELLEFPEEKGFLKGKMLGKAPPFYWLSVMQRDKYRSYDLSESWYKRDEVRSIIMDNYNLIADICQRDLLQIVLDDHRQTNTRVRAISFLLTVIYFKKALGNA